MDRLQIREMFSSLNYDIFDSEITPEKWPLIAHYTSIQTFESILKNNEIWMSNAVQMNDYQEHRYGMAEFLQVMRTSTDVFDVLDKTFGSMNANAFFNSLEMRTQHLINGGYDNIYVFSASEYFSNDYDGNLSLWRGYNKGGLSVALVFDPKKIKPLKSKNILFYKVSYLEDNEMVIWCKKIANHFLRIILTYQSQLRFKKFDINSFSIIDAIADTLFNFVKIKSIFSKHVGFKEEQEWRMVVHYDESKFSDSILDHGYKYVADEIRPTIRLKLAPPGTTDIDGIQRIIVGPTVNQKLTRVAIESLLKTYSSENLVPNLFLSKIPYRN